MLALNKIEEYHRPTSIADALKILQNSSAAVLAGGTHLLSSTSEVKVAVDINHLGLSYINEDGPVLRIGATTSLQEIASNPAAGQISSGILAKAAHATSVSRQLRNAKTVAGEIVSAKPESLLGIALLAVDARLKIIDGAPGEKGRVVGLDQFYKSKSTNKGIITEIEIPLTAAKAAVEKLSVIESSVPIISVAVAVSSDKSVCTFARVAVGSGVTVPYRILLAEGHLMGRAIDKASIDEAAEIVFQQVRCFTDTRASAEYRQAMSRVLIRRALITASGLTNN